MRPFFFSLYVLFRRGKKRIEWISFIVFMYHNGCENDNVFLFSNHFGICLKNGAAAYNLMCDRSNRIPIMNMKCAWRPSRPIGNDH